MRNESSIRISGRILKKQCMLFFTAGIALVTYMQAAYCDLLTFEGLQDMETVLNFYAGGRGSYGSGPGPNFGISFALNSGGGVLIDSDNGGSGSFANEPSPSTILYNQAAPIQMNVPMGFTSLSFFYSAPFGLPIEIYDDIGGTGNLLVSTTLTATPDGPGDPAGGGAFGTFVFQTIPFMGTARSAIISNGSDPVFVDDMEVAVIPEPAPFILISLGGLIVLFVRGRKNLNFKKQLHCHPIG